MDDYEQDYRKSKIDAIYNGPVHIHESSPPVAPPTLHTKAAVLYIVVLVGLISTVAWLSLKEPIPLQSPDSATPHQPPTEAPRQPYTEAPRQPTETPRQPTETPRQPTETPRQPTETPREPTETGEAKKTSQSTLPTLCNLTIQCPSRRAGADAIVNTITSSPNGCANLEAEFDLEESDCKRCAVFTKSAGRINPQDVFLDRAVETKCNSQTIDIVLRKAQP